MIVWLDSFLTNVDRTVRNTNILLWQRELWLIDHGASLYFHHSWNGWEKTALTPFPYIKDHALIRDASMLREADEIMRQRITPETIRAIVDTIPDDWLDEPEEQRKVYTQFLTTRLENSNIFTDHAITVRQTLI